MTQAPKQLLRVKMRPSPSWKPQASAESEDFTFTLGRDGDYKFVQEEKLYSADPSYTLRILRM